MLRKVNLKTSYTSEVDDIYADFFVPSLSACVSYQRAVGYFSLSVLLNAPAALSQIIENEGKVELIFGKLVSPYDFEAIRDSALNPWEDAELPSFEAIINDHKGSLLEYRVRLLAWLFKAGKLEMKVAIRPEGLFHQKIGILRDRFGDTVSFSGSMNETMSALDPRYNSEEITVFKSWKEGQGEYIANHQRIFDKLWSEQTGSSTIITSIPEAMEAGLNFVSEIFPEKPSIKSEDEKVKDFFALRSGAKTSRPRVPEQFNGKPFEMRAHQMAAIRSWASNSYNGILELATGAGKTVTALYAATRLIEQNDGMALVVAVPYQDLADQWCKELAIFNIRALQCYGSRAEWENEFKAYLNRNRGQQEEFLAIVVVNKTLKTKHFQDLATQLDPSRLIFIGDECHHHSSEGYAEKMLPGAKFRIGLSATPFHYLDEERNVRLRAIYDRSVFTYTLADAVRDGVLTPYEYHPIPVELKLSEATEYLDLSDQIARLFALSKSAKDTKSYHKMTALLMRRSRLIGSAANKLPVLSELLDKQGKVEPYSLFYCGDGRTQIDLDDIDDGSEEADNVSIKQRHAVSQILAARGVRVSPFTSEENRSQRREILRRFKEGQTEALVAIRCLDEGIDVPACRTAYLLASSRNPRQFVQRRGRILRKSEGKDYAKIFDFVVVLPENYVSSSQDASDFLKNELGRVADFARNSLYPSSSIEPLMPWLRRYRLEHLAV